MQKIEIDSRNCSPEFIKEQRDKAKQDSIKLINGDGEFILISEKFDKEGKSIGLETRISISSSPKKLITWLDSISEIRKELIKASLTSVLEQLSGE